jgi:aldehyde:ferredoxin oxidoreductase
MCVFTCFGFPENSRYDLYRAITGLNLTRNEWAANGGLKTLQIQRAQLLLGGPDLHWNPKVDDDNPIRFYEPLPSGPCKGQAADKTSVSEGVQKYYKEAGWDANGIPKSETLLRLGLGKVDDALKKLR